MRLSEARRGEFARAGMLMLERALPPPTIAAIQREVDVLTRQRPPGTIYEAGTPHVRALHGIHLHRESFDRLARHPFFLEPARQLLDGEVYLHQSKVVHKSAFVGGGWQWHQDSAYWSDPDGLRGDDAVSAMVFLGEIDAHNAPLLLVPGSHRCELFQMVGAAIEWGSKWSERLTADSEDVIPSSTLREVIDAKGLVAATGPAGTVLWFHSKTLHASGMNLSSRDRRVLILSYNGVHNRPLEDGPRPDFLAGKDYAPLRPWPGPMQRFGASEPAREGR